MQTKLNLVKLKAGLRAFGAIWPGNAMDLFYKKNSALSVAASPSMEVFHSHTC